MTATATETTDAGHFQRLPEAPTIPGLRFRYFRHSPEHADFKVISDLEAAANLHDGFPYVPDPENTRLNLTEDDADLERDIVIAEVDGSPVGYAAVWRSVRDGAPIIETWGHILPEFRRRGLGRALFANNVRRARERAAVEPTGLPVSLGAFEFEQHEGAVALLNSEGFEPIRYFFTMRHPDTSHVPDLALPDGLEIRPVTPDQYRAIYDAEVEAFRDHWNHREKTEADYEKTYARPELDTALWVVAWDGDEVAGVVQTWIWASENEALGVKRGWLEHVSVRRPWRRRGLGRALTAEAVRRLAGVGMTEALLGVDSQNPTGALGTYEAVGFEVYLRELAFRRDLEV